jgi:hypothetical protein
VKQRTKLPSYAQGEIQGGEGDVNTIEKALCVVRHKMLEKQNIKNRTSLIAQEEVP